MRCKVSISTGVLILRLCSDCGEGSLEYLPVLGPSRDPFHHTNLGVHSLQKPGLTKRSIQNIFHHRFLFFFSTPGKFSTPRKISNVLTIIMGNDGVFELLIHPDELKDILNYKQDT